MLQQRIKVQVERHGLPQRVRAVEGDSGRTLEARITDMEIPTDSTARIYARKPSGAEIYNDCSINGNIVEVELTTQMTAESGTTPAQIEITKDGKTVTSFDFLLDIDTCRKAQGSIESSSQYTALENLVNADTEIMEKKIEEYIDNNPNQFVKRADEIEKTLGNTIGTWKFSVLENGILRIQEA